MRFGLQKNIWLIPIGVALTVAITGWWCNSEVRRAIESQLETELESMISADVTALEIWIQNQLRFVESLAGEEKLRAMALELVARAEEEEDGVTAEALRSYEEGRALRRYVEPRIGRFRLGFVVLDDEGVILSGPFEGMLGDQLHEEAVETLEPIFEDGESVLLTPYQPPRKGPGGRRFAGRGPQGAGMSESEWEAERNRIRAMMKEERERDRGRGGGEFPRGGQNGLGRSRGERPERGGRPEGPNPFKVRGREDGLDGPGGPEGRLGRGGGRRNRTIMAVGTPLYNEDREVVAALGLIIQPEREFTRILSVAQPGESGETFAFDENGIMLSQSRFEESLLELGLLEEGNGSALNLELRDPGVNLVAGGDPDEDEEDWPLNEFVEEAIEDGSGSNVEGFRDYRGVPVVGAWRWLPDHQFGVVTKLDASEAFQPLRVLRLVFLILLLLSVLFGLGLFLYSYTNVMLRRRIEDAALEAKELGQYTLEKKIGEGGMGSVYRAHHALLRRDTAVKLLLPDRADETSIKRFEREVQMTCRLAHPNTIQIFDYGHTPEGIFYYAMEYLDGINLRDLVQLEGALPEGRVVYLIEQICASLSEAHEAGLVHRDIKPANVIVSHRGGVSDLVKVLDFGLVKSSGSGMAASVEASNSLTITGTPQFISPEAVSNPEKVDQRSDLYAVGALGYYLAAGCHVFEGDSAFTIMQQHVSEELIPLSERLGRSVDPVLESVIHACLAKRMEDRPQSAREVLRRLSEAPCRAQWTEADREAWWQEYQSRANRPDGAQAPKSSTILEPTLQINLGDRTRVL